MRRLILSVLLALPAWTAAAMPMADLEAYLRKASAAERKLLETFVVSCGTSLRFLEKNDANGSIPGNVICNTAMAQWESGYHAKDDKAADALSDLLQEINTDVDPLAIGEAYRLLIPLAQALTLTRATAAEAPASSP